MRTQKDVMNNLCELKVSIEKSIYKHCQENPETTREEVNSALVGGLNARLARELKEL
jgi:hypothetical protein